MELNPKIKKDNIPVLIAQLIISLLLIGVGLYNCTVNGIDRFWISLIVFPISVFLPHPQAPDFPLLRDEILPDQDQVDGPTPESINRDRQYNLRRAGFICYICACLVICVISICCLALLNDWQIVWTALMTVSVGCLLPTPLVLLY